MQKSGLNEMSGRRMWGAYDEMSRSADHEACVSTLAVQFSVAPEVIENWLAMREQKTAEQNQPHPPPQADIEAEIKKAEKAEAADAE